MVLPPLASILAAAVVALLSTAVILHTKGVEFPLWISKNQAAIVLFTLTPSQRQGLLHGDGLTDVNTTTQDIRNVFQNEGYVIVRGLLDDDLLNRLNMAGNVFMKQSARATAPETFSTLKFGPIYLSAPSSNNKESSPLRTFREVAMNSAIPSFIAQVLLDLQPDTQTLRVLKDVFLAKGNESDYCGWHVDDQSFWPIKYNATTKTPGVNAWIAMDDIPAKHGGGLAVAPRSHHAKWRHEAYNIIGSTPTYPNEGYDVPGKMFENYKTTTCNLAKAAPNLSGQIDRSMHVFDFQRGDVLIHTRWLFHRSVPLDKAGAKHYESIKQKPVVRRYSIRYEVGDARLLQGFIIEPSVVLKQENAGKTLDEISANDSPWYPQCWPEINEQEMARLHEIVEEQLPAFEPLKQELLRKVLPYLRKD